MAHLNPYLSYEGNAREAMNFYKDCLGGELQITNVSDMPEMAKQMPESMKNSVLHSELKSGDVNIYATDCKGDLFGSLKDKFGKDWLFNAPIKK